MSVVNLDQLHAILKEALDYDDLEEVVKLGRFDDNLASAARYDMRIAEELVRACNMSDNSFLLQLRSKGFILPLPPHVLIELCEHGRGPTVSFLFYTSFPGAQIDIGEDDILIQLQQRVDNAMNCYRSGSIDLDRPNERGETPLYVATKHGLVSICHELIDLGATPFVAETEHGLQPIHVATIARNIELVAVILQSGADVNAITNSSETSLYFAVSKNHADLCSFLISLGADVSIAMTKVNIGWQPLHLAAHRGYLQCAKILIEHGAMINAAANKGITPLHLAIQSKQLETTKYLLEQGANPSIAADNNIQPLHLAAKRGLADVCELLLQFGADVNALTRHGLSPLHLAIKYAHYPNHSLYEILINHGADLSCTTPNGQQPLHLAILHYEKAAWEVILQHNVDLNFVNEDGFAPIHLAARLGREDVCQLLAEADADLHLRTSDGKEAFHLAVEEVSFTVCQFFLDQGFSMDLQTADGITIAQMARESQDYEIECVFFPTNSEYDSA